MTTDGRLPPCHPGGGVLSVRRLGACLSDAVSKNGYGFIHTAGLTDRQLMLLSRCFGALWNPAYRIRHVRYDRELINRAATFGREAILPHCEGTYETVPPRYLLFYCDGASRTGGDFYLVSMRDVLMRLKAADRHALRTTVYTFGFSEPRTRKLIVDVNGVSDVLLLSPLPHRGEAITHWVPVGPNRAADRLLRRVADIAADPLLRKMHRWRRGDVVVVDNARFLHGREAFTGRTRHLKQLRIGRFDRAFAAPTAMR